MGIEKMKEQFNKQLETDLRYHINEFLTKEEYSDIKELYKNYFDVIVLCINKFGVRLAIEDIANLEPTLSDKIISNILLLKEINIAIKDGKLTKAKL